MCVQSLPYVRFSFQEFDAWCAHFGELPSFDLDDADADAARADARSSAVLSLTQRSSWLLARVYAIRPRGAVVTSTVVRLWSSMSL